MRNELPDVPSLPPSIVARFVRAICPLRSASHSRRHGDAGGLRRRINKIVATPRPKRRPSAHDDSPVTRKRIQKQRGGEREEEKVPVIEHKSSLRRLEGGGGGGVRLVIFFDSATRLIFIRVRVPGTPTRCHDNC